MLKLYLDSGKFPSDNLEQIFLEDNLVQLSRSYKVIDMIDGVLREKFGRNIDVRTGGEES